MVNIVDQQRDVLDHGFVRVVDTMGDDPAIVQAARVSYGTGTKAVNEDRGLIRYLMRHWHSTPFEMCEIKLHVKLPIFVARQWVRHRTANINEMSARYSILDREFYVPERDQLKLQSTTNNQGRGEAMGESEQLGIQDRIHGHSENSYNLYSDMNDDGLARELSRMVLPTNIYTQWYWKVDLHNLFHFLRLRADPHAQYEIRVYAEAICDMIKDWVPQAYEAFVDYRLQAKTFSRMEMEALKAWIKTTYPTDPEWGGSPTDFLKDLGASDRELAEFEGKFQ